MRRGVSSKNGALGTSKAVEGQPFTQAMRNLNQDVAYQDKPAFKAFLETDSKRVIEAVRLIGKV